MIEGPQQGMDRPVTVVATASLVATTIAEASVELPPDDARASRDLVSQAQDFVCSQPDESLLFISVTTVELVKCNSNVRWA